jgi:hypothetical protein
MNTSHLSFAPVLHGSSRWFFRRITLAAAACLLAASLPAQPAAPSAEEAARRQRRPGQESTPQGGRGNFDPAQMQERMLNYLRDQFEVADDTEWNVIAERIAKVVELRRSTAVIGGGLAFAGRGGGDRGGAAGADSGRGRGGRPGGVASPEQDALRTAVVDKLPDAEIKARLARLREVRKQNTGKLEKAQEELRAVLTIRQEAIAVVAGLIP